MIKTLYEKGPYARGAQPPGVEWREMKRDFGEDVYDAWAELKISLVELKVSYDSVRLCPYKKRMLTFLRKIFYRNDGKMHCLADAKDSMTERSEGPGSSAANQVVVHAEHWGCLVKSPKSIKSSSA